MVVADGESWGKCMELIKGMLNWDTGTAFNMGAGAVGSRGTDAGIGSGIGAEFITRGGGWSWEETGFAGG